MLYVINEKPEFGEIDPTVQPIFDELMPLANDVAAIRSDLSSMAAIVRHLNSLPSELRPVFVKHLDLEYSTPARLMLMRIMGSLVDEPVVQKLFEMLFSHNCDPLVCEQIGSMISLSRTKNHIELLTRGVQDSTLGRVRALLLFSLRKYRSDPRVQALLPTLTEEAVFKYELSQWKKRGWTPN